MSLFLRGIRIRILRWHWKSRIIKMIITSYSIWLLFWNKRGGSQRKGLQIENRCVWEEYDWYLYKDRPLKRARRQGEKDEKLVVTSDHIRFKIKFLHVVNIIWQEIYAKDRDFVVAYNRNFNNNGSTDEIDVPCKITQGKWEFHQC